MRRFANFTNPVPARCCSRVLLELEVLSCSRFTSFAAFWPAIGQHQISKPDDEFIDITYLPWAHHSQLQLFAFPSIRPSFRKRATMAETLNKYC
jgi:hypothetical protein